MLYEITQVRNYKSEVYDSFKCAVNNSNSLKMIYLKGLLQGPADCKT